MSDKDSLRGRGGGAKSSAALSNKEKELIKKAEKAAQKRGLSLLTWLRMSGFDLTKKPQKKKFVAPKIIELSQKSQVGKPIIIESPKGSGQDNMPKPVITDVSSALPNTSSAPAPKANKAGKRFMLETELRNPILRTEFDKVLRVVDEEGIIGAGKLKGKLGIDGATLKECYKMLQKAGKIRVEYPLFGPPLLISTDYERAKKRLALIKKGIEPEEDADGDAE